MLIRRTQLAGAELQAWAVRLHRPLSL